MQFFIKNHIVEMFINFNKHTNKTHKTIFTLSNKRGKYEKKKD